MKKWALILLLAGIITTACLLLLPLLASASNCGGNSAPLNQVRQIALEVELAEFETGNPLDVATLPLQSRTNLSRLARYHWTADAKYLIRKQWHRQASKREILAICDTAFSNVPQPTFWNGFKKTPAHAVAYNDGTTGLVSEREFNQMRFSEFVDVGSLTGSVSNPTTSPQNGNR